MGANTFVNSVKRSKDVTDAKTAFKLEVERSQYESGRSYSGEIGMKREFKRVSHSCKTLGEAYDHAEDLMDKRDDLYGDKWGPAFMLEVEGPDGGWVFFGWAPS